MRRPRRGTVILLTIVALGTVVVLGASLAWATTTDDRASGRNSYCAILPDSIGLYAGNSVTQMGYRIGKISSITPQYSGGVKVTFDVRGRPIPKSVYAVTRSKSVLADRSLELVGNASPGAARSTLLAPNTCIPMDHTRTPRSISEITASAANLIDQLAPADDGQAIAGATKNLYDAINGIGPGVAKLMRTASSAAQNPEQVVSDIGSIITTMNPMTGRALSDWENVASIIRKVPDGMAVANAKLWPGLNGLTDGMIPLQIAVYDIKVRYQKYLWPAFDLLSEALHIAAAHVGEIKSALSVLPSVASTSRLIYQRGRGAGLLVDGPILRVHSGQATQLCQTLNAAAPGSCRDAGQGVALVSPVNAVSGRRG